MRTPRRRGPRKSPCCGPWVVLGPTRSAAPLLHDNARGSQELAVEAVTRLEHASNRVVIFGRKRWLRRNGFVQRRIKSLIERIDDLEPGGTERLEHLLLDQ